MMRRILRAVAPAKVNLGLEVLGRRPDGYHDVVSVLQAISLFDRFEWHDTGTPFSYTGPAGVPSQHDLIARALSLSEDSACWTGHLRIDKHIPAGAGLGGGSSDAALALRLALPWLTISELSRYAKRLGADVPFFLRGGTALASGIGTMLEPIPTVRLWFVLVTPPVVIDSKTSALYAGLTASDFSDGAAVLGIADRLRHGLPPDQQVPNAFARQLMSFSAVRYAYDRLTQAGSRVVSISGAGPTVYAVTDTWPQAAQIVSRLPQDVGEIRVACAIHASDDQRTARLALALRGVSPE